MQSDQQLFNQNSLFPISDQVGGSCMHNAPNASGYGGAVLPTGVSHSKPFRGLEFQPSEVCPKNFIIFNQTESRNQIMFHPAVVPRLCYPGFNICSSYFNENVEKDKNIEELPSSLEEDSNDIDALLSLEEEDQEEYDEEEVSTAHTLGNYESDSSDSCSNYSSKPRKSRKSLHLQNLSGSGSSCNGERKRKKMREMVKALRGIVPGGNKMSTLAVLDEAVKYLKSLNVEVQKVGVDNLEKQKKGGCTKGDC